MHNRLWAPADPGAAKWDTPEQLQIHNWCNIIMGKHTHTHTDTISATLIHNSSCHSFYICNPAADERQSHSTWCDPCSSFSPWDTTLPLSTGYFCYTIIIINTHRLTILSCNFWLLLFDLTGRATLLIFKEQVTEAQTECHHPPPHHYHRHCHISSPACSDAYAFLQYRSPPRQHATSSGGHWRWLGNTGRTAGWQTATDNSEASSIHQPKHRVRLIGSFYSQKHSLNHGVPL